MKDEKEKAENDRVLADVRLRGWSVVAAEIRREGSRSQKNKKGKKPAAGIPEEEEEEGDEPPVCRDTGEDLTVTQVIAREERAIMQASRKAAKKRMLCAWIDGYTSGAVFAKHDDVVSRTCG